VHMRIVRNAEGVEDLPPAGGRHRSDRRPSQPALGWPGDGPRERCGGRRWCLAGTRHHRRTGLSVLL
jgi:hypothetical protein